MYSPYQSCVEYCQQCAAVCEQCLAACLKEENPLMMMGCIRLDMECISVCRTAAQLIILESNHANAVCQLCADVCSACAEECEKHNIDHCIKCAAMCRDCAAECMSMAAA
jgi:hypothetical protein